MSFIQREVVTVTTDGSGNATAYSGRRTGKLLNVIYTADGSTPYDNTVDFTITVESTAQGVWTESNISASKTVAPRQSTHDTSGAAALYAAGGTAVRDKIAVAEDRIKIALAQGGATKTGTFTLIWE